ncbi:MULTISPECIES: hypothetical protein [unclassified Psychrobacter]|uniref:hypothetical protein n=1 Tax=unclassified Psychrobacter TaxID=196806 RepID=UPI0018D21D90|nr:MULTISPECIES: hypothetical protein [unclassified Psychrobacter]
MDIKAAVTHNQGAAFELKPVQLATPEIDEIRVKVVATGVCHTDVVARVFIPQLIAYFKAGQFPFDKLVKFYDFEDINQAFEDSASGITIKPILRVGS